MRQLDDFRPQMALLDIGLPGVDGYELARRMRAEPGWRRPALVALTGYGQDSDRARASEAGFDEHLVKPVASTELTELIARYLG
jgi:CheY-like chemotaxis protein